MLSASIIDHLKTLSRDTLTVRSGGAYEKLLKGIVDLDNVTVEQIGAIYGQYPGATWVRDWEALDEDGTRILPKYEMMEDSGIFTLDEEGHLVELWDVSQTDEQRERVTLHALMKQLPSYAEDPEETFLALLSVCYDIDCADVDSAIREICRRDYHNTDHRTLQSVIYCLRYAAFAERGTSLPVVVRGNVTGLLKEVQGIVLPVVRRLSAPLC